MSGTNGIIEPMVEPRLVTDVHKGLFVLQDISKETVLYTIRAKELIDCENDYSIQYDEENMVPAEQFGDFKYINHGCEANVTLIYRESRDMSITPSPQTGIRYEIDFVASKNIKKDEQLFFNYLTTEYFMHNPFECWCGSHNCFKIIGGYVNIKEGPIESLELAPHIQRMIKKMK